MADRFVERAARLIPASTGVFRLVDRFGRTTDRLSTPNAVLAPGRVDALKSLFGQRSFGTYTWIELGSNGTAARNTQLSGCISPLLRADNATPFRAQGEWRYTGTEFTFEVIIPGTDIEGAIREAALYPTNVSGQGPALFRYVLPAALFLTDDNALSVVVTVRP